MEITFPSNTVEIIDGIRKAIGRPVTFIVITGSGVCTTCGINPFTNQAIDPLCPVCSGLGYIYTYSGVTISGHVTWGYSDLPQWVTGGQYFDGDCVIQIKFTDEILNILEMTKYVIVDNKSMRITKKIMRGVPQINRILLGLRQEDETDEW